MTRVVGDTRRIRPAHETVAWLEPRLREFGITRVADITGLDHIGIPVVMACRPNGRSLSVAQGKGTTIDAAKASGIMEAIEVHHAEQIDLPVRLSTLRALRRRCEVADPTELVRPLRSAFGPDLRLPWIEATGITSGRAVWVPFELVDLDFTVPAGYPQSCFSASSNGLASGNHDLEARVHALCEVIERDAEALWRLGGAVASTRVDLATVDGARCRALLDRFADADVDVAVWDATSDVGIPVFVAVIADSTALSVRRVLHAEGSGAHPDKDVALERALTEAAQSRLTMIAGSRDDRSRADYQSGRATDRMCTALSETWRAAQTPRSFAEIESTCNPTLEEDLDLIVGRLDGCGVPEPLVVDLTRPDVGIPVVKVIVPTMEPDPDVRARPGVRAMRACAARHRDSRP